VSERSKKRVHTVVIMMPTTGITMRRTEEMTQNARLSRSGSGLALAEASVVLRTSLRGFPTTPLMNSVGHTHTLPKESKQATPRHSQLLQRKID
jgi:hypothetical protein